MLDFTAEYLRCVNCRSGLSVRALLGEDELEEGFLDCRSCGAAYPVISKVPIVLEDIPAYFSIRTTLAGELMLGARSREMKSFMRDCMKKIGRAGEDTSGLERRWAVIYSESTRSAFYSKMRRVLQDLRGCGTVLEHGCSVGLVARDAARKNSLVLGIDKSFYGILAAKKGQEKNSDFVVADSLKPPFGGRRFDTVLALNLLDIVEPRKLICTMARQAVKYIILADPYDFERGKNSVKHRTGPCEVRDMVRRLGFSLALGTARQSRIPWNLRANPRLTLRYLSDLVVARRR